MHKIIAAVALLLTFFFVWKSANAQGVFVTQGEDGRPIFSNQPQPGAREVTLPPLSVVPAAVTPAARTSPQRPQGASQTRSANPDTQPVVRTESIYDSLDILFPAHDSTVVTSTGVFEVQLDAFPSLFTESGDTFAVRINGRDAGRRFSTPQFAIPDDFWGGAPPPNHQEIRLDAAIVDANGQVLKRSKPVHFVLRRPVAR